MMLRAFDSKDFLTLSEALEISEEKTGDYFKFSFGQWKRHRYDVKTLSDLTEREIVRDAFAFLEKGSTGSFNLEPKKRNRDFYRICLQDHRILKALKRDKKLELLPLLVYVFTHELVHIVRFCNFSQRYEACGREREKEESLVHGTTYHILKDLALKRLDYILESYENHRICVFAKC